MSYQHKQQNGGAKNYQPKQFIDQVKTVVSQTIKGASCCSCGCKKIHVCF